MDYLTELKADNKQLSEIISHEVDALFESDVLPLSEDMALDRDILKGYLAKPGRGLGGSFVMRMSELHEPQANEPRLHVGAAMEVVNAAQLIIDDWLDDSDFRKGHPAVHKSYGDELERIGTSPNQAEHRRHIAEGLTAQLGIVALYAANLMVLKKPFPQQSNVLANIQRGALHTTAGLMFESRVAYNPRLQTRNNAMGVYRYKSVDYAFSTPMKTGLILADADNTTIETFDEIAYNIGMAFQFQDDMMLFGDPSVTGKPKDDDIRDGVYSLLYDTALANADYTQRAQLHAWHGQPDIQPAEADEYRAIMRSVGADQIHQQAALQYLERAGTKLDAIWQDDWNPQLREYLTSLIHFLLAKDYR